MKFKFNFPIEIPLFLSFFGISLLDPISTNLYIYRTCYTILKQNKTKCAELGREENDEIHNLETLVQPTVNHIQMVMRVCDLAVPIVLCMFVGTWSDKFGRKPFLILSLTGLTVSYILNTIFTFFENLSPWYFIVSSISSMFTGGASTLYIIITLYIADSTTANNRVFRLGVFEAVNSFCSLSGYLVSSYLLYATNYTIVYGFCAGLLLASVLYSIFLLPESLKTELEVPTLRKLISMMNFYEIIKPSFKKREGNKRFYVLTLLCLLIGYNIGYRGDLAVQTLFLRQKLDWTLQKVTLATSYGYVTYTLGALFGTTVLYKKLQLRETHLILISIISQGTQSLLFALATNSYYIYIGFTVYGFSGLGCSLLRTIISYLIPQNELGKVYTTSIALDSLIGTVASSGIYPMIYNATIETNSGTYNFFDVGVYIIMFITLINLMRYPLPHSREQLEKQRLDEEMNTNENTDIRKEKPYIQPEVVTENKK